jgi:DNA (cytosine-5)-methyltransferase 1
MPDWKKVMVMRSRVMYENNYKFIDAWIKKHGMQNKILIQQKFEWNCGKDCNSIKQGIIQIRQSGVRVKRPNYFPSLVAMNNTPIIWDEEANKFRYFTPKESAKLQSFKEDYLFSGSDVVTYRQLGNSVNVKLVRMFAEALFKFGKKSTLMGGKKNG